MRRLSRRAASRSSRRLRRKSADTTVRGLALHMVCHTSPTSRHRPGGPARRPSHENHPRPDRASIRRWTARSFEVHHPQERPRLADGGLNGIMQELAANDLPRARLICEDIGSTRQSEPSPRIGRDHPQRRRLVHDLHPRQRVGPPEIGVIAQKHTTRPVNDPRLFQRTRQDDRLRSLPEQHIIRMKNTSCDVVGEGRFLVSSR